MTSIEIVKKNIVVPDITDNTNVEIRKDINNNIIVSPCGESVND